MNILTFAGIFLLSAANSHAIYHDGWIDLNKNGHGTFTKIRRSRSPGA